MALGLRLCDVLLDCVVFFKQKTAYEVRISDWSSDVCSSDLTGAYRSQMTRHYGKAIVHFLAERADRLGFRSKLFLPPYSGHRPRDRDQIGKAQCRERVCQYV